MELQQIKVDGVDQNRASSVLNQPSIDSDLNVLNKSRSVIVTTILSLVLFVNSVSTGILTVGIPRIAADLKLSEGLLLW